MKLKYKSVQDEVWFQNAEMLQVSTFVSHKVWSLIYRSVMCLTWDSFEASVWGSTRRFIRGKNEA